MIYFFDIKGLVEELKTSGDRSRQSFLYLVTWGGLWLLGVIPELFLGKKEVSRPPANLEGFLMALIFMALLGAIAYWFFSLWYEGNGGRDGKSFLDRLVALNFVASLRIFIPSWTLILVNKATDIWTPLLPPGADLAVKGVLLVGFISMLVYWYRLVYNGLREVRRHEVEIAKNTNRI